MALLFCPNNLDLVQILHVFEASLLYAFNQERLPHYAWGTQFELHQSNQLRFFVRKKLLS